MPSTHPYVIDITENNFEKEVLHAPEDVTIVVDFWAPWCGPCRTLSPILERVAESYGGRVKVAKINTDENEMLSAQFGIQGIPAVKIFRGGEMISEFTGALPEMQIRQILDRYVSSESDDIAAQGHRWLQEGETLKAKQCFDNALAIDPGHVSAKLGAAKIALLENDIAKAEELAKSIELNEKEYGEAQGILNKIAFMQKGQPEGESDTLSAPADENDLDARYAYACSLAAAERYQEALEEFLAIIKKNKKYKDGAAKDAMVKVFSIIGQRSPLADEYRDKLEWVLY